MTVDEAIKQVAQDLNLNEFVVRRAYYSVFEFIKDTATKLPLKEEFLSKEELQKLKKVFHIPALGKIDLPYTKYETIWKRYLNKRDKK